MPILQVRMKFINVHHFYVNKHDDVTRIGRPEHQPAWHAAVTQTLLRRIVIQVVHNNQKDTRLKPRYALRSVMHLIYLADILE